MKKLLLILLMFPLLFTQTKAIDFYQGTYQQALQKAKTENKRLLLYFTASWCGPCKYMEQYVYPDAALKIYVNQNYVPLKIDIDTQDGKLLYIKSHQPRGPMGVPAFIILNTQEEVLKKAVGGKKLSQLKDFLLINKDQSSIYKLLTDSVAKVQIIQNQKKPTAYSKFMYNAMVSDWKPAFKSGTNYTHFSGTNATNHSSFGYEIGFFMDRSFKTTDKKISFWHHSRYLFQPGISLTAKGGAIDINATENKIDIHYLELNLQNSYQFKGMRYYRVNVSPYAAKGLWANREISSHKTNVNLGTDFTKMDYGIKLGLSRSMGTFEPFIGYQLGLRDIKSGPETIYNRGFYLSFAIIAGK